MPYKDFVAGTVLPAADVDTYLMRQTVMTFADAAARNTALSGVLDEGMVAYLEDANELSFYDGANWQVLVEAPKSWTPEIFQSGARGLTVNVGWYQRSNGILTCQFDVTFTDAGAAGNAITLSLPLGLGVGTDVGGSFMFIDSGTANYVGTVSTTGFGGSAVFMTDGNLQEIGITPSFAIASGDKLRATIIARYI